MSKEWIDKYRGKFDAGWDKLREETLAKQIDRRVVPHGTKLAPKPEFIKDWDSLSADEKRVFARQMEVFAGFGEYTDREIVRLVQAIADQGQLDNTLTFYENSAREEVQEAGSAQGAAALRVDPSQAAEPNTVLQDAARGPHSGAIARTSLTGGLSGLRNIVAVRRPSPSHPISQHYRMGWPTEIPREKPCPPGWFGLLCPA